MDDDDEDVKEFLIEKEKEKIRENATALKVNKNDIENQKKQKSYEDCFSEFLAAFENEDLESVENTLHYLGYSSKSINFIDFPGFWTSQFISKLFSVLSSNPPPDVIGYIFNIFISIITNAKETQAINILDKEFFDKILPVSSINSRKVIIRMLSFFESVALISQRCRDIVVENVPFDFFVTIYNDRSKEISFQTHDDEDTEGMIKLHVLSIFAAICFFPAFESNDLLQFVLTILNHDDSLKIIGKCINTLYFLEMNSNDPSVLNTISIEAHLDYGHLIHDLFNSKDEECIKDCTYLLKLLSDMMYIKKENDIVPIDLLISIMKPQDNQNMSEYLLTFHSSVLGLLDSIASNCDPRNEPFQHEMRLHALANCRDLMRDSPSTLKTKAAILVGSLMNHLTTSEMEKIIEFQILIFLEPILFMCDGKDLIFILQWIFTLLSYKVDPQLTSLIKYSILHSNFNDTLDEVADNAEDEGNDEVVDLVTKLKLLIDFDSDLGDIEEENPDSNDDKTNTKINEPDWNNGITIADINESD